MLRWTVRIALVFVVLIAVLALVVHLVLHSQWLGGVILSRVSDRIGMEVSAESFSVGWWGTTSIRKAAVTMPLSDETLLTADRIELGHAAVPLLIFGRPVDVESVEIDSPQVSLRRYGNGRWNVQDVWSRLKAGLGSDRQHNGDFTLPRIAVRGAAIRITEPNGISQRIGPLVFKVEPRGQLVWAFDLEAPELCALEGRLLRGGDWAHEIGFAVGEVEPLIRDVFQRGISPVRIAGRWDGRVWGDAVHGTVRLEEFAVGQLALRGNVLLRATPGQITLAPRDLTIDEPNLAGEPIRLTAGAVRITREHVEVERLVAKTDDLAGRLTGRWDLGAGIGELSGSWMATPQGQPFRYHGVYQATVKSPPLGRKEAELSVSAEADTAYGTVNLAAKVHGTGTDWRQSQWRVSVPTLLWSRGEQRVDMTGATAELRLEWPVVRLTSLHMPNAGQTSADGQFNADTRRWSARLEANDLDLDAWDSSDLDLLLVAEGDDLKAHISKVRLTQGGRIITAEGYLSFRERGLQNVQVVADWPAGTAEPGEPRAQRPTGRWHLEADITGPVQPLAIEMAGQLTGQNIALGKQTIGRVEVPLQAKVDAKNVIVTTQPFDLLGGQWQLNGQYVRNDDVVKVSVVADHLSLEAAAGMAGLPLTSKGGAHAQILLAVPNFDIRRAVATGSWSAEDVNIPPLEAQRAHGKLRISGGLVRFEDTVLEHGDGRAQASMEFRLDDPQNLSIELTTSQWPVRLEGRPLSFYADGQTTLRLNVVSRTANGQAKLSGRLVWQDRDLARIRVATAVQGQTLNVQGIYVETLDGSIEGKARVPLNRWTDSVARLDWQGIRPNLLKQWVPQFEKFEGIVSGSLAVDQMEAEARPPEPMRLSLDVDIGNGRYGPADIGVCHIVGYLGKDRLLVDEARFQVADGQIDTRARVSRHVGRYFASVFADFNELDLDQLVHTVDPNAGVYAGVLSGRATVLSSTEEGVSLGGEAEITLEQSDLVSNSVVQALHGALNLRFGEQQPTGTGEIKIRLEGPSVIIPSFAYFNRGVEIRGAGQIKNVNLGADSPVDGYAVASTRVLKGINLPGVAALDRLTSTFQTGAASVKIGGTLDGVEVKVVPLPIVLGSFRRLLWSQLRE